MNSWLYTHQVGTATAGCVVDDWHTGVEGQIS